MRFFCGTAFSKGGRPEAETNCIRQTNRQTTKIYVFCMMIMSYVSHTRNLIIMQYYLIFCRYNNNNNNNGYF